MFHSPPCSCSLPMAAEGDDDGGDDDVYQTSEKHLTHQTTSQARPKEHRKYR